MSLPNIVAIVWGTLEIFLFAGQIFGWSSLAYVFKYEGYFENLCDEVRTNTSFVRVGGDTSVVGVSPLSVALMLSTSSIPISAKTHQTTLSSLNSPLLSAITPFRNEAKNGSDRYRYAISKAADAAGDASEYSVNSCAAADERFSLIYTLAQVFAGITIFCTGYLKDRLGTRLCRCVGIVCYLTAVLLVAFSTQGTAMILLPAMMLLAYGADIFLVSNFELANLSPRYRSTIISLYCGAYDSSAFTMVLVKLAYDNGIPVKASFLFIAFFFTTAVISTFWFMPRHHVPFQPPRGYRLNFGCCNRTPSVMGMVVTERQVGRKELADEIGSVVRREKGESFKTIVVSKLFLLDVLWLTCQRFQSFSFVGRLNPTLDRLANNDKGIVSGYLSVYGSLQFLGIFFAPLSGRLMDRKSHADVPPALKEIERLEACMASFFLDTTVGLLLALVASIPVLQLQYVAFLLHVIHRAFLYGPHSAFIAHVYNPRHFGKLFGLAMSCSAAFSVLQYPLFVLVRGSLRGDPFVFNMVVLMLMLVSFVHPVYIWRHCRANRRAFRDELAATSLNGAATDFIQRERR